MAHTNLPIRTRLLLLTAVLLAAVLVAQVALTLRRSGEDPRSSEPTVREAADEAPGGAGPGFVVTSTRAGALAGVETDEATVAAARKRLREGGVRARCGPYAVWWDVGERALLEGCARIVADLDDVYESRFGIRPTGRPVETLFLFAELDDYRAFAVEEGLSAFGYSGHSIPSRGYVAVWAGEEALPTLVHELGHVLNRRALGGGLPRWLDEGLADALGDTASATGLQPLEGARGARGQLERLLGGYAEGRVGGVERLVSLPNGEFDRGAVSYDYEQSAFLVRYLLSDPRMRDRFRALLDELAAGLDWEPALVPRSLETTFAELDTGFVSWLSGLR